MKSHTLSDARVAVVGEGTIARRMSLVTGLKKKPSQQGGATRDMNASPVEITRMSGLYMARLTAGLLLSLFALST